MVSAVPASEVCDLDYCYWWQLDQWEEMVQPLLGCIIRIPLIVGKIWTTAKHTGYNIFMAETGAPSEVRVILPIVPKRQADKQMEFYNFVGFGRKRLEDETTFVTRRDEMSHFLQQAFNFKVPWFRNVRPTLPDRNSWLNSSLACWILVVHDGLDNGIAPKASLDDFLNPSLVPVCFSFPFAPNGYPNTSLDSVISILELEGNRCRPHEARQNDSKQRRLPLSKIAPARLTTAKNDQRLSGGKANPELDWRQI
ncbi:hypothetical protein C8J56DRAFT_897046 [Mycena floridula]|nr:hypothetical protein C8J56DRAFT_897046 [Mycena floridula]